VEEGVALGADVDEGGFEGGFEFLDAAEIDRAGEDVVGRSFYFVVFEAAVL
jgi:hypothetical protein